MPGRVDEKSVHHGGDLELNSCLHMQPVKTLQRRLDVCSVIQSKYKPSGHAPRCRGVNVDAGSPYSTELQ